MTIWQKLPKPFVALAPMEDVTDHVFRRVVAKSAQPDLFFSEFTNATGWVHAGDKATGGRLVIHPEEKYPLIAQIWGGVPADIAQLAQHCRRLGFAGIDLNMGCPDKSAVKNGGGAACIQQPELAAELIAAAKTAGLPVSVKTRLGYSRIDEWPTWLGHLLKQDITALTVHLRTKKEMSKVPAHWEIMPEIKILRDQTAPQTLLIGNGDVRDHTNAIELASKTGIDGVMIGRGIFTNIFAFENIPRQHSQEELLELLACHLNLFESNVERQTSNINSKPYETLKRFFKIYVRDFDGAGELRAKLMETKSIPEARKIIATQKT